jgi:hypothetical protein
VIVQAVKYGVLHPSTNNIKSYAPSKVSCLFPLAGRTAVHRVNGEKRRGRHGINLHTGIDAMAATASICTPESMPWPPRH